MRNTISAVFALFFLLGCERTPTEQTLPNDASPTPTMQIITGYAQGTTYTVKFWTTDTVNNVGLKQSIDGELARIDKLMSNYREDSAIEKFNQDKTTNTPINVDKEILALLEISNEVYEKSQHCYDPTIKPLFQIWGFSKDKLNIPNEQTIAETLKNIGFNQLQRGVNTITKPRAELTVDLSAIGQGYAVSQIARLLEARHITNYLVEIGGEMLVAGTKPNSKKWRIGVERPVPNSQKVNEVITLTGKRPTAIMTSGTYRHYFDDNGKQYSHLLDPRSGKPVEHNSVAVTVLLDDATRADAWSTALLCLGADKGLAIAEQNHIPAIFYTMDGKQLNRLPNQTAKEQADYWQIK